jgi:hypothetical protein
MLPVDLKILRIKKLAENESKEINGENEKF